MPKISDTTTDKYNGPIYVVTGVTVDGKRFRLRYRNRMHAMMINLYRGSVWEERDGKRKLIKREYN